MYRFRDEISTCIEKAYEKIAFQEAARMLFFESQKPMKEHAAKVIILDLDYKNVRLKKPSGSIVE
jgi:hypothetical protein